MQLYILRHGEAGMQAPSDAARELTTRGVEQTAALVQVLNQQQLRFELALVSPYRRAQQTAAIVLDGIEQGNPAHETCDLITPEGHAERVIEMLAGRDEDAILLVSHQPFVADLINLLVNGQSRSLQRFPPMLTSSIASLTMDVVAPGCAKLEWLKSQPDFNNVAF